MITLAITAVGSAAGLQRLRRLGTAAGLKQLHEQIALDAEALTKAYVAKLPDHNSANRLGAAPTNHLADQAKAISSEGNAQQATIKIPRKGRLRAAFGAYVLKPGPGKKFLTIPVAKDSYGRRAAEFGDDLFVAKVGPLKQPVLARRRAFTGDNAILNRGERKRVRVDASKPLEVLFILVKQSQVKEKRDLLPSDQDYRDSARDSSIDFINSLAS